MHIFHRMYINCENISVVSKLNVNITIKIIETNDCNKNNEIIVRTYILKIQEVELLISVKIAKGVINIKTFNII